MGSGLVRGRMAACAESQYIQMLMHVLCGPEALQTSKQEFKWA